MILHIFWKRMEWGGKRKRVRERGMIYNDGERQRQTEIEKERVHVLAYLQDVQTIQPWGHTASLRWLQYLRMADTSSVVLGFKRTDEAPRTIPSQSVLCPSSSDSSVMIRWGLRSSVKNFLSSSVIWANCPLSTGYLKDYINMLFELYHPYLYTLKCALENNIGSNNKVLIYG